jgi:hypothetical protein
MPRMDTLLATEVATSKSPEPTEPPRTLVAAAANMRVSVPSRHYRPSEAWQADAWEHYDLRGPLRYSTNWFANALSRCTLHAARRGPKGIEVITTGPAYEAMEELNAGSDGNSSLLKAFGQHFFIAGDWYLVGRGTRKGDRLTSTGDVWEVISTEEMRKSGDDWFIDYGNGMRVELGARDTIIRMWNPHPRRRLMADSPTRAALGDLREYAELCEHIRAQVISRLAGAGILVMPSEMSFTGVTEAARALQEANPGADPFLVQLTASMMAAKRGDDVSRFVPIIVKVAGEYIEKVQHLKFWSELDDKVLDMRKDALSNLATSIDLPREVLLGTGDANHWGAWQVEESTIKAHIEPALEVMAGNLTTEYLRPLVPNDPTVLVVADTSKLRLRPNRSKEALELHDRGSINDAALRRETGFEEDDALDDEGRKLFYLRKIATGSATPPMVDAALKELGVDLGLDPADLEPNNRQARPDPSLVDHPETGPPERMDDRQAASLMATCEVLVYRAMERAGNKLKNRTGSRPPGVSSFNMHTLVSVQPGQCDALLEGAWDNLPTLLHGIEADPHVVSKALDAYTRNLLTTQREHDSDLMQRHVYLALEMS